MPDRFPLCRIFSLKSICRDFSDTTPLSGSRRACTYLEKPSAVPIRPQESSLLGADGQIISAVDDERRSPDLPEQIPCVTPSVT
jgi:hypothetical protein